MDDHTLNLDYGEEKMGIWSNDASSGEEKMGIGSNNAKKRKRGISQGIVSANVAPYIRSDDVGPFKVLKYHKIYHVQKSICLHWI